MPLLSADELAAIRARAETRVRLGSLGIGSSTDPDQIIWRDDQSAATVDDLRELLGHIDALTAERALADEITASGGLVAELLAQWQMGIFHGCLPSGVQASVPGVLKRWHSTLARHADARHPQ